MKAAVLHGREDLRYEEYPTPGILPGYVKVRVAFTGICGSDIPRVLANEAHYYPIVLGHEFSGTVTEIGEGVTSLQVGDHVAGVPLIPCLKCRDCQMGNYSQCRHYTFIGSRIQGSFAEYVVLPERNAVKIDPSIPFEQGAMFEPCTVSLHGLKCADYRGGGKVAVIGCGTIGIFALQWAKIFGAEQVVAFATNEKSLELATRLGADAALSTKEEGFLQKAMELTGNHGFDYVFEAVGAEQTMIMAMELAANKAHVCYIGTPKGNITFTQRQWENLNRKELQVTGSWMSGNAPFPGDEWELAAHYFATGEMKFDPQMVYAAFPMSRAAEAFACYKEKGRVKGRILLYNE